MVSPKRKTRSPSRTIKSPVNRSNSVRRKLVSKSVKCNDRVVKKEKGLVPKSLKSIIDGKLKPKAETEGNVGFGAELKALLNNLAQAGETVPALYKKPLDAKGCYVLVGNNGVDTKGDILNDNVFLTHLKYCNAVYPDEVLSRQVMCNLNDQPLLPSEFNQLTDEEIALVRAKCDVIDKNLPKFWNVFSLGFANESEKKNYIDTVERYLMNPVLDPHTNKPWRNKPEEAGLAWNETLGFKRFYRLAGPYLNALRFQFNAILQSNSLDLERKDGESELEFSKRLTKERNLVYDYINDEVVCKTSSKYVEILMKVALFQFYVVQVRDMGLTFENDTDLLRGAFANL